MKKVLKSTCANKGLRLTKQREVVLKVVRATTTHPDAETVHMMAKEYLPEISLDTVYRNLQILEDLGLIFRVDNQIPSARFDADLRAHSHFICTACNEVYDIFEPEPDLDYSKYGDVLRINIQVKGICNSCKKGGKL